MVFLHAANVVGGIITIIRGVTIRGLSHSNTLASHPLVRSFILYLFQGIRNGSKYDFDA